MLLETISFDEFKQPYWYLILELLDVQPSNIFQQIYRRNVNLVLGEDNSNTVTPYFINLAPYGRRSGVSGKHLSIRLNKKEFVVLSSAKNPVYLNNKFDKVESGDKRQLVDGDVLYIGETQITVKFVKNLISNQLFCLKLQQYGKLEGVTKERDNNSISPEDQEFEIVGDVAYPRRIVRIAKNYMKRMELAGYEETLEDAIREAIEYEERLRHAIPADPNEPIQAVVSVSKDEA